MGPKAIAALVMGASIAFASPAWPDSSDDKAREFVHLSGSITAIQQVVPGILADERQIIRMQRPNADAEAVAMYLGFLKEELERRIPTLENYLVAEAVQDFTEGELDRLIAFFKTPLGRKYVRTGIEMQESFYRMMNQWALTATQEATDRAIERLAEAGRSL